MLAVNIFLRHGCIEPRARGSLKEFEGKEENAIWRVWEILVEIYRTEWNSRWLIFLRIIFNWRPRLPCAVRFNYTGIALPYRKCSIFLIKLISDICRHQRMLVYAVWNFFYRFFQFLSPFISIQTFLCNLRKNSTKLRHEFIYFTSFL